MVTEDYKEGFVKACMAKGCNLEQTETLYKVAFLATAFDNEAFKKGFGDRVVPGFDPESLPLFAKSELVHRAAKQQYGG